MSLNKEDVEKLTAAVNNLANQVEILSFGTGEHRGPVQDLYAMLKESSDLVAGSLDSVAEAISELVESKEQ